MMGIGGNHPQVAVNKHGLGHMLSSQVFVLHIIFTNATPHVCRVSLAMIIDGSQGGAPIVISWFIKAIDYRCIYIYIFIDIMIYLPQTQVTGVIHQVSYHKSAENPMTSPFLMDRTGRSCAWARQKKAQLHMEVQRMLHVVCNPCACSVSILCTKKIYIYIYTIYNVYYVYMFVTHVCFVQFIYIYVQYKEREREKYVYNCIYI